MCVICAVKPAKYTCAACGRRTCSLACVNAHKSKYECAGTRGIGKWSDFRSAGSDGNGMQSLLKEDYVFLEDVCRVAGAAKRIIHGYGTTAAPEGAKSRNKRTRTEMTADSVDDAEPQRLPHRLSVLRQQAERMGIDLRFMPSGMQRHDCNTTVWMPSTKHKAKKKAAKRQLTTPGKDGMDEAVAPLDAPDALISSASQSLKAGETGNIAWRIELEFPAGEPPCRFTEAAVNDQTTCISLLDKYLDRVMDSSAFLNAAIRQQLVRYQAARPPSRSHTSPTTLHAHGQVETDASSSGPGSAVRQEVKSESNIIVLYRHPFAVHGIQAYVRIPDLDACIGDVLKGKVVIEYPTFVVLPRGIPSLNDAYPTLDDVEARFPAAICRSTAAVEQPISSNGSVVTDAPAAKKAVVPLEYATPTPWSAAARTSSIPPAAVHPDALLRALQADGILSSHAP
jgi:hypothetical protein